jgi:hypothetical protein
MSHLPAYATLTARRIILISVHAESLVTDCKRDTGRSRQEDALRYLLRISPRGSTLCKRLCKKVAQSLVISVLPISWKALQGRTITSVNSSLHYG